MAYGLGNSLESNGVRYSFRARYIARGENVSAGIEAYKRPSKDCYTVWNYDTAPLPIYVMASTRSRGTSNGGKIRF